MKCVHFKMLFNVLTTLVGLF